MDTPAARAQYLDIEKLIKTLNEALADKWLAYFQYRMAARAIELSTHSEIESELKDLANEELSHAEKIAERVFQLGGTPVTHPRDWSYIAENIGKEPENQHIEKILVQIIDDEQCAVKRYRSLAETTKGKDEQTYEIVIAILKNDLEHKDKIQLWIKHIKIIKEVFRK